MLTKNLFSILQSLCGYLTSQYRKCVIPVAFLIIKSKRVSKASHPSLHERAAYHVGTSKSSLLPLRLASWGKLKVTVGLGYSTWRKMGTVPLIMKLTNVYLASSVKCTWGTEILPLLNADGFKHYSVQGTISRVRRNAFWVRRQFNYMMSVSPF